MFEKYTSIEHHYQDRVINRFLLSADTDVLFQITEKLDGANFSVEITQEAVKYGKRTQYLSNDASFFDWQNAVDNSGLGDFVDKVQQAIPVDEIWIFYGELYGQGVQKRINYGGKKDIKLFEMKIDGEYQSPETLLNILHAFNATGLHVPVVGVVKGLENALAFDTEIPSSLSPTSDEIEGVVIKPYSETIYSGEKRLIIKKKNKKFSEKMGVKARDRKTPGLTEEQEEFKLYINKNRLASIVSQYGEPSDSKDIRKYISLLGQDALIDFAKDKEIEITKSKKKELLTVVGRLALPMIKIYL